MQLIESILADAASITTIRRDIHAHPELCFQEERTADVIAKALTDWGIPIHRGLGKTGVVGIVKNGSSSRAIGLRADIDALPMTEHNHFAHASTHAGKMHACGHDGHTAMLLAAARHLSKHRNFDGTVYLVFQPAEEGGGGAREMMKDGLFDKFPMEAIFGIHNWPGMKVGQFALKSGPVMASSQRVQDHHPRQGQPRRAAAQRHRPGAGGLPDGAGLPDHRHAQQEADRHRGDLGDHDPRRRGHQRGARLLRDPGHGAHLHHRGAGPGRAAHEGHRRKHLRRLRGRLRVRVQAQLPAHRQPRRPRPSSRASCWARWSARTTCSSSSRPWAPRTSATSCRPSPAATSSSATATARTARAATAWARACCTTPATTSTTT